MGKHTTQEDVARFLDVPRSTVAMALSAKYAREMSEETRARVKEAVRILDYKPHRGAQTMRTGRSNLIGVINLSGMLQVGNERAFHAAALIHEAGYQLMAADASWFPGEFSALLEQMLSLRIEGLLIMGMNEAFTNEVIHPFLKAKIPVVAFSSNEIADIPIFRPDVTHGSQQATEHLLEQGCTKVILALGELPGGSFVRDDLPWTMRERVAGFRSAVESRGGKVYLNSEIDSWWSNKDLSGIVLSCCSETDRFDPFAPGRAFLRRLHQMERLPDGISFSNDDYAVGAESYCMEHNIAIPGSLALTGFNDGSIARYASVPLTSVEQPTKELAARAVNLLVKSIKKESLPEGRIVRMPCKLTVRESSLLRAR